MPNDAQLDLHGTFYKINTEHNMAMIWLNGGWVKSAKSANEIYSAIEAAECEQ